ncbi:Tuberous sclerosis 2-like protein [Polyrhizophydium stewartii]|uniref:Tuberous sclerosis 2-like protein n=1 Tax=Polyrhizophydium stewartii TaxID=2732419 RepID=A0ABR4NBL2_9FUNG|nr:Tuberous sclerosis 2-like protein [Polyrhizophydium stewartii]
MSGTLERLKTTFSRRPAAAPTSSAGPSSGGPPSAPADDQVLSPTELATASGLPEPPGPAQADGDLSRILADLAVLASDGAGSGPTPDEVSVATSALAALAAHVRSFSVAHAVPELWPRIFPALSAPPPLRALALEVVVALLESHFDSCELLRLSFFKAVSGIDPPLAPLATTADSGAEAVESAVAESARRLRVLRALTRDGRNLRHLEHMLGRQLLSLVRNLSDAICAPPPQMPPPVPPKSPLPEPDAAVAADSDPTVVLQRLLAFTSNVIKFSSTHLRGSVLAQLLVQIAALVQQPAVALSAKSACLDCFDSLARYSIITDATMPSLVQSLCSAVANPQTASQAWSLFEMVKGSHHFLPATSHIFDAMSSDGADPDPIAASGWTSVVFGSLVLLRHLLTQGSDSTLDAVLPDSFVLQHLVVPLRHRLPVVTGKVLEVALALIDKHRSRFSGLEWELVVDIYSASTHLWLPPASSGPLSVHPSPSVHSTAQQLLLHSTLGTHIHSAYNETLLLASQAKYLHALIEMAPRLSFDMSLFLVDQTALVLQFCDDPETYVESVARLMDGVFFSVPRSPLAPEPIADPDALRSRTFGLFTNLHAWYTIAMQEQGSARQPLQQLFDRVLERFATESSQRVVALATRWILELCHDADLAELELLVDVLVRRAANVSSLRTARPIDLFNQHNGSRPPPPDDAKSPFQPAGLSTWHSVHAVNALILLFDRLTHNADPRLQPSSTVSVFRWITNIAHWVHAVPREARLAAWDFLGSLRANDQFRLSYVLPPEAAVAASPLGLDSETETDPDVLGDRARAGVRCEALRLYTFRSASSRLLDESPGTLLISPGPQSAASAPNSASGPTHSAVASPSTPPSAAVAPSTPATLVSRHAIVPIGAIIEAAIFMFKHEVHASVLHAALAHLTSMLENHSLLRGSHAQIQLLRVALIEPVSGHVLVPTLDPVPRKSDLHLAFLKLYAQLIPFKYLFAKTQQDEILSVICHCHSVWPSNAKFCLHVLTLALVEMPLSANKIVALVLERIIKTTSQSLAVANLEFLSSLARVPEVYADFNEMAYRNVFGIAVQYIRSSSSGTSSDAAVSSYVTELAFHVISLWFMNLKLSERLKFVPFIIHRLISSGSATTAQALALSGAQPAAAASPAGSGATPPAEPQINEHVELVLEMMAQNTFVDCWPKPSDASWSRGLAGSRNKATRTWIQGNALISVTSAKEPGWAELVVRRPTGVISFWIHLENVTQRINSVGQPDWLSQTLTMSPMFTLPQMQRRLSTVQTAGAESVRAGHPRGASHSRSVSVGSAKDIHSAVSEHTGPPAASGDVEWTPRDPSTSTELTSAQTTAQLAHSRLRRAKSISMTGPVLGAVSESQSPALAAAASATPATSSAALATPTASLVARIRDEHRAIDPSLIPMQFFRYPSASPSTFVSLRQLPDTDSVARAVSVLDRTPVIDLHKIGIVYVGPGQSTEQQILSNTSGSRTYTGFLHSLGRLFRLPGCRDVYTGGLDTSSEAVDGEFGLCSADDQRLAQVIFHATTLMPNRDYDPTCTAKKRHIGNDFVTIVWNEGGAFTHATIPGEFNFFFVLIEPLGRWATDAPLAAGASGNVVFVAGGQAVVSTAGLTQTAMDGGPLSPTADAPLSISTSGASAALSLSGSGASFTMGSSTSAGAGGGAAGSGVVDAYHGSLFRVSMLVRPDLPNIGQTAETAKLVTGASLSAYVRHVAIHANMLAQILAQRTSPNGFISNSRERLRQFKRLRDRLDTPPAGAAQADPLQPPGYASSFPPGDMSMSPAAASLGRLSTTE